MCYRSLVRFPKDIQTLLDDEYSQIRQLLKPGRRQGSEARGRIRTLLAIQAHKADEVDIGDRAVGRAERAIKNGATRNDVLPNLATVGADVAGEGINVTVRFTKNTGAPVRYAEKDEDAAAIKIVDSHLKFHLSRSKLAEKLSLSTPRAAALRWRIAIEDDENCYHSWTQGKTVLHGYSDNALRKMREALSAPDFDMNQVVQSYRARSK